MNIEDLHLANEVAWNMAAAMYSPDVERTARLLNPGGQLYVFEGHPLDWVWEPEASEFLIRQDGGDYFSSEPRTNRTFPASAVMRETLPGHPTPQAFERQWGLGPIVTQLVEAGLSLERLEEYPEEFWPQFRNISEGIITRLPHSFSLLMRKPSEAN